MSDLYGFLVWQAEAPERRTVDIKVDEFKEKQRVTIWVYDHVLMVGQYVETVDEIDMEARKEVEDRAKYEDLKKKFE